MNEIEELYNDINNAIAKCDKCEDCEFYGDKGDCQNKRIAQALINAGYRKQEVKTNGDKIRSMSDKELSGLCSGLCMSAYWDCYNDGEIKYKSILTENTYIDFDELCNANLEWLKKEWKEK